MINLLPTNIKSDFRYAKYNVVARKWIVLLLIAWAGLILIGTYGLLAIRESSKDYQKQINISQKYLEDQKYSEVQKQVEQISGSFKLVVNVLSQEVLFSKIIQQIAKTIPQGANLTGLTINQTNGAIDITANAVDYNTATQVQINLADPNNKIFSKADILNINCVSKSDNDSTVSKTPCTVNVRALFANNKDYLFIYSKGEKK